MDNVLQPKVACSHPFPSKAWGGYSSIPAGSSRVELCAKALLARLLARVGKAQEQLNEVATQTREMRERVQCDRIVREGRFKLAAVDEALETPYLTLD